MAVSLVSLYVSKHLGTLPQKNHLFLGSWLVMQCCYTFHLG